MTMTDSLLDDEMRREQGARIAGVVVGIVTNNSDAGGMGRVKVRLPWLSDKDESNWARVAAPMAGNGRGFYCLPEVGDEVLVAFECGDMNFPYVLGALWGGKDKPPATNEDEENNVRVFKSRSGHVIRFTDKGGEEKIEIIGKDEKRRVVFDIADQKIQIECDTGDIEVSAPSGTVKVEAQTVEVKSKGNMNLEATGQMTIKGATVNIN
jgi:uncharacterized protein involved in type VI secretion and phage assembly